MITKTEINDEGLLRRYLDVTGINKTLAGHLRTRQLFAAAHADSHSIFVVKNGGLNDIRMWRVEGPLESRKVEAAAIREKLKNLSKGDDGKPHKDPNG